MVRYFNSYGPRIDPRGYGSVVASFLGRRSPASRSSSTATAPRPAASPTSSDTVRGTFLAGTRKEAEGTVVNLGNPTETSVMELAAQDQDRWSGRVRRSSTYLRGALRAPTSRTPAAACPTSPGPASCCRGSPRSPSTTASAGTLEWWKQTY